MSDSDSSSDSDDDYLTQQDDQKGSYDREALVRKKLLENFYGKTAAAVPDDDDSSEDDDDNADNATFVRNASQSKNSSKSLNDLDSVSFDSKSHAAKLIRDSSVHDLLETEDRLALQVRTLDSTMQTLVYENYSRFIDATDAIRSIGVNVQANEIGLRRLSNGMDTIDTRSKEIEDALGSLRDQVAEKLRIKRLLSRLDALLKLPQTLREQINVGKYRTATRSYISASSILRKHSEGFGSLKIIETECNSILADLGLSLKTKMLNWSGRINPYDDMAADSDDEGNEKVGSGNQENNAPDPPKSMTDVFECAGTLFILREEGQWNSGEDKNGSMVTDFDLTADDLQSMTVSACMRLLDRLLDSHLIQVQERRFAAIPLENSALDAKLPGVNRSSEQSEAKPAGSSLIPRGFLDAVLEGATLYGMSFGAEFSETRSGYLMEFVSEALSSFFSHIRSILYEESIEAFRSDEGADENGQDDSNNLAYAEIAGALALLVQYVRELASGLSLPEVGINAEYASKIVDQAMQLTESMVRRRVDQKFQDLRVSIVRHCLLPFASRTVEERDSAIKDGKPILPQIIQIASSTLSDCLQLVDDTIRSIFAGGLTDSAGDLSQLRDAVYASTFRFASWLANAFEMIAGGDSADPKCIIEASLPAGEATELEEGKELDVADISSNNFIREDRSDFGGQERALVEMLESARAKLVYEDDCNSGSVHPDFILGIAELCRLSYVSVPENLDQSVAAHAGGNKKKSRGMFPNESQTGADAQHSNFEIAERFLLAASRVLVLFATNAGDNAASILCKDLRSTALKSEEELPAAPRDAVWQVLNLAKTISIQCYNVFGGNRRAGPVPEWDNNSYPGLSNTAASRKTGLHLDVERMFKERVTIYPHPSEMLESSRNAIIFLFFKVCFRELLETARLCCFSLGGLAQVLVDLDFLKHMLPHYLSSDFVDKGVNACAALSNLLDDVVDAIEDRLSDGNFVDLAVLKRDSQEIGASFLRNAIEDQLADEFVIDED